jgi:hypothetical protein
MYDLKIWGYSSSLLEGPIKMCWPCDVICHVTSTWTANALETSTSSSQDFCEFFVYFLCIFPFLVTADGREHSSPQIYWKLPGKSCCGFIAAFIAALLQHSCVLIYKSLHPSGRDIAALSQIYCSFITAHTDTIYKILGSDIAALSQILSQLYCRVGICHICRFLSFDIATLSQLYRDFYCSIGRILKCLPTGCGHGGGNPLLVGRVMWEA